MYNRGIAGNRAEMSVYLMDEEIFALKPDFCFVFFCANDLGIWLYDGHLEETETVLAERAARNDRYFEGIKAIVQRLKERGVVPVLCSAYPGDERIKETGGVLTVADNKEKKDKVYPDFYTQKTYRRINKAYEGYAKWIRAYAEKEGCLYFDLLSKLHKDMLTVDGLYEEDGLHFSRKGNSYFAKAILEYLGYENVGAEFKKDEENDRIFEVEQKERTATFVPYNTFNPLNGEFTEAEIVAGAKETAADDSSPEWLKAWAESYLLHKDKMGELREEVKRLTEAYLADL